MLIVSKFHDYYDVGMRMGVDKTVVYQREQNVVKGAVPAPGYTDRWCPAVLAFCGTFYPFIYRFPMGSGKPEIIWDLEEALLVIPNAEYRRWDSENVETETGLRQFFDKEYPELEEIYHEYKSPIFSFTPVLGRRYSWQKPEKYKSLLINPCIKDLGFFKVKDPITAFQEIYMFISGVIGVPEKSTIKISDEVMAASKGHDGEYSFRKPPGKRGKNKWR